MIFSYPGHSSGAIAKGNFVSFYFAVLKLHRSRHLRIFKRSGKFGTFYLKFQLYFVVTIFHKPLPCNTLSKVYHLSLSWQ